MAREFAKAVDRLAYNSAVRSRCRQISVYAVLASRRRLTVAHHSVSHRPVIYTCTTLNEFIQTINNFNSLESHQVTVIKPSVDHSAINYSSRIMKYVNFTYCQSAVNSTRQ